MSLSTLSSMLGAASFTYREYGSRQENRMVQLAMKILARVAEYISALGMVEGIRIFVRLYSPAIERPITLSGSPGSFVLRGGTTDRLVFEQVFIRREYECPYYDRQPTTIIDGGPNIGLSSVYFANRYPSARILAIEPDEANYQVLVRNSAQYANIRPLRAALWPVSGKLAITNPTQDSWAFRMKEVQNEKDASVHAITMEESVEWAGGSISILKLDIEGGEHQLFGAANLDWLEQVEALIVEPHDWIVPGSCMSMYRAIAQWEYDQFIREENLVIIRRLSSSA
jgi:FkbM family methyltransferase